MIYDGLSGDKINSLYVSGLIDEATRRDFLKKMGAGAVAATTGADVSGLFNFGSVDPLKGVSDLELKGTPEVEWVFKVPYGRLLKILRDDPEYVGRELIDKFYYAGIYGYSFRKSDSDETLKNNVVGLKALAKAALDAGIERNDIFKDTVADWARNAAAADILPSIYSQSSPGASMGELDRRYLNNIRELFGDLRVPLAELRNAFHSRLDPDSSLADEVEGQGQGQGQGQVQDQGQDFDGDDDEQSEFSPEDFMYLLDVPEDEEYDYETSMEDRMISQIANLICED